MNNGNSSEGEFSLTGGVTREPGWPLWAQWVVGIVLAPFALVALVLGLVFTVILLIWILVVGTDDDGGCYGCD